MVNKTQLSKGKVDFKHQMDRPTILLKKSYEGAANQFHHLYDTEKSASALGHFKI